MATKAEEYIRPYLRRQKWVIHFDTAVHGIWLIPIAIFLVSVCYATWKGGLGSIKPSLLITGFAQCLLYGFIFMLAYFANSRFIASPKKYKTFPYLNTLLFFIFPVVLVCAITFLQGNPNDLEWRNLHYLIAWDSPLLILAMPFFIYKAFYLFMAHQYVYWTDQIDQLHH